MIIIALSWHMDVDIESLIFTTSMIIVILVAFTTSALLRNLKKLQLSTNYAISGIIGLTASVVYYSFINDNLELLLHWIKSNGVYMLLLIILLSAFLLYFNKSGHKIADVSEKKETPAEENQIDKTNVTSP